MTSPVHTIRQWGFEIAVGCAGACALAAIVLPRSGTGSGDGPLPLTSSHHYELPAVTLILVVAIAVLLDRVVFHSGHQSIGSWILLGGSVIAIGMLAFRLLTMRRGDFDLGDDTIVTYGPHIGFWLAISASVVEMTCAFARLRPAFMAIRPGLLVYERCRLRDAEVGIEAARWSSLTGRLGMLAGWRGGASCETLPKHTCQVVVRDLGGRVVWTLPDIDRDGERSVLFCEVRQEVERFGLELFLTRHRTFQAHDHLG